MKRTLTTSFALLILAASGLASAGPEKTEKTEKDVLKGPKVVSTDTSDSATKDSMTSTDKQMDPAEELKKNPILFREYISALKGSKNKNDALQITDQQQEQIAAIMKDHRQAMADFQEANRDQIREMRDRMQAENNRAQKESSENKPAIEKSKDKDAQDDKQADRPARQAPNDRNMQAREKLRAYIDNAPPNKEAISKLKQVLNPEQFSAVDNHVLAMRARVQENANRPTRARPGAEDGSDEARPARRRMNPDEAQPTGDKEARNRKGARGDRPEKDD